MTTKTEFKSSFFPNHLTVKLDPEIGQLSSRIEIKSDPNVVVVVLRGFVPIAMHKTEKMQFYISVNIPV